MYIGNICSNITPAFYHANTDLPLDPKRDGESYIWTMSDIYDSAVDAVYSLDKEYYIGTLELNVSGALEVSVFVDGVKVSVKSTSAPIYVGLAGSELTVRLRGNVADMRLDGVKMFGFCPSDGEPFLIPQPKSITNKSSRVKIGCISGEGDDGIFVKSFFEEGLKDRLEGVPCGEGVSLSFIVDPTYENESYSISVSENGAVIVGASRIALLWGACRLFDLWDEGTLPVIEIKDKPDVPMRGFHMGLPRVDRIDFAKRLVKYVLLPLGYNHIILEFNGDMRYDSHPEITEKWLESEKLFREGKGKRVMHADIGADGTALEKSEVRELVEYIDSYGIEIIPEVQTLSHIEYITNAHPELAELGKYFLEKCDVDLDKLRSENYVPEISDTNDSGINHPNIFDHCYCPRHKGCMDIVFDIIDEVVEVVRPRRYVHIGHDEVYHIGLCRDCREKGAPRVYVEHVKALHAYLAKKGLKTMLWSDMLHTDMYYTGEEYDFVRRELPKDLMLLDFTWYYHLEKDIEDFLLPEGYEIMMGNLYSSHYPRFAERIKKNGMVGGEVSTWTAVSEEQFALNGKFFDLPYTAEMLWNAYGYDERNRPSLTTLIGQLVIPEMRDLMHGRYDLYLATDIDSAEPVGTFPGSDRRVPGELSYLELVEPKGEIEVKKSFDRLIFAHATVNPAPRICWQDLVPVGKYTVVYSDGESVDIPVDYAGGILHTGSCFGLPMPQHYYRHQGYVGTWFADPVYEYRTNEGSPILLLGQIWDNPKPDKIISSISYTPSEKDYAILVSAGVLGVKLD